MPGVTVEASSPVLIEKTRDAVTDGQGQYRIIDLRPGTYTVTFTLSGFNHGETRRHRADGRIHGHRRRRPARRLTRGKHHRVGTDRLSSTFRARRSSQVLTRDLLDAVPTGRNIWGTGATLTGVTLSAPDVGGTAGMQQTYMAVHGSERRDNAIQIDGMSVNGIEGDGAIQNYFNQGMFEEMSYSTSALGAEVASSGVRLNMIPKDGSNSLQGIGVHLADAGQPGRATTSPTNWRRPACARRTRVEWIFDQNFGLGGPIMQNRWWFYGTFRRWGVDQSVTDSFYNADPTHRKYVQDYDRPVIDDNVIKSGAVRFTFQLGEGPEVLRVHGPHRQVPRPRVRRVQV